MSIEETEKKSSKKRLVTIAVMCSASVLLVFAAVYFIVRPNLGAYVPVYVDTPGDGSSENSVSEETENPEILAMLDEDKIYQNIFIDSCDVSLLTKEEARIKADLFFDEFCANNKLPFYYEDTTYSLSYADAGCVFDVAAAVDEAYNIARNGSYQERYNELANLLKEPRTIEPKLSIDRERLNRLFEAIKSEIETPPVPQGFKRVDGEFVITPGTCGLMIDMEDVEAGIIDFFANEQRGGIVIVLTETEPGEQMYDYSKATALIGQFTTDYVPGNTGRNQNLKNACEKINNIVLMPGEQFSTNAALGDMTYENGYDIGKAIVNGLFVDNLGGGVCQVSSTLYNAALFAEIEIVSRLNHSQKVAYLDYGYDATLARPAVDLILRNNTDYPVTIESYLKDSKVYVNIYGYEIHKPTRTLVFENAFVSSTPPPAEEVKYDSSLPKGQRVVEVQEKSGYKYNLYKLVYENGELIEKVLVNTSSYRALRGVVIVGTKEVPEKTNAPVTDMPVTEIPYTEAPEPDFPATEPPLTQPPYTDLPDYTTQPDPDPIQTPLP